MTVHTGHACHSCGGPLEIDADVVRQDNGVVRILTSSCDRCGAVSVDSDALPLPPPWRDRMLATRCAGLLIGRTEPAALAVALRRSAGFDPRLAAARAGRAPGIIVIGLPAEIDALVDAIRCRGLDARRVLTHADAAPDVGLREGDGPPPPVSPTRLAARLRAAARAAGGSGEGPGMAWGAPPRSPRALQHGPRVLWTADGRPIDTVLGPQPHSERVVFERVLAPPPETACVEVLRGPSTGIWPLSPAACAGMQPARVLEALWSGASAARSNRERAATASEPPHPHTNT